MSDGGDCRTAQDTPGLLKILGILRHLNLSNNDDIEPWQIAINLHKIATRLFFTKEVGFNV